MALTHGLLMVGLVPDICGREQGLSGDEATHVFFPPEKCQISREEREPSLAPL